MLGVICIYCFQTSATPNPTAVATIGRPRKPERPRDRAKSELAAGESQASLWRRRKFAVRFRCRCRRCRRKRHRRPGYKWISSRSSRWVEGRSTCHLRKVGSPYSHKKNCPERIFTEGLLLKSAGIEIGCLY
jgi:hypothetical protein